MIWASIELRNGIEEAEMLPNLWADHNPIKIRWYEQKRKRTRWTLNTMILKEPEFCQKAIQMTWDTAKVIFRGIAIAYSIRNKAKRLIYKRKL